MSGLAKKEDAPTPSGEESRNGNLGFPLMLIVLVLGIVLSLSAVIRRGYDILQVRKVQDDLSLTLGDLYRLRFESRSLVSDRENFGILAGRWQRSGRVLRERVGLWQEHPRVWTALNSSGVNYLNDIREYWSRLTDISDGVEAGITAIVSDSDLVTEIHEYGLELTYDQLINEQGRAVTIAPLRRLLVDLTALDEEIEGLKAALDQARQDLFQVKDVYHLRLRGWLFAFVILALAAVSLGLARFAKLSRILRASSLALYSDYIVKPFTTKELLRALGNVIPAKPLALKVGD